MMSLKDSGIVLQGAESVVLVGVSLHYFHSQFYLQAYFLKGSNNDLMRSLGIIFLEEVDMVQLDCVGVGGSLLHIYLLTLS